MEQVVETANEALGAAPSAYRGNTVTPTQDASAWRSRLDTSRTPFHADEGSPIFFQRDVISGCPAWVGIALLVLLVLVSLLGL